MITIKKFINKIKIKLYQPAVFFAIGLVVIILISIPLAKKVSYQYKMSQEIKNLEKEIKSMQDKNVALSNLIKYLESDQFITEQAHLKLNYKKEGEEVVVIKDRNNELNATGTESSLKIDYNQRIAQEQKGGGSLSNPIKWWRYFFVK